MCPITEMRKSWAVCLRQNLFAQEILLGIKNLRQPEIDCRRRKISHSRRTFFRNHLLIILTRYHSGLRTWFVLSSDTDPKHSLCFQTLYPPRCNGRAPSATTLQRISVRPRKSIQKNLRCRLAPPADSLKASKVPTNLVHWFYLLIIIELYSRFTILSIPLLKNSQNFLFYFTVRRPRA